MEMMSYKQAQKYAMLRPIIENITQSQQPRDNNISLRERWRQHSMAQTKHKYQKAVQLQHNNYIEKNQLNQQWADLQRAEQIKVKLRARKVRSQMGRSSLKNHQWKEQNMKEAAQQREQKIVQQYHIASRAYEELQEKKKAISGKHHSMYLKKDSQRQFSPNQTQSSFFCGSVRQIARRVYRNNGQQTPQSLRHYLRSTSKESDTMNSMLGLRGNSHQ